MSQTPGMLELKQESGAQLHETRAIPVTQDVWVNTIAQPLLCLEVLLPLQCGVPQCVAHRHRLQPIV